MADPITAAVAVGWGMKAAGWLAKPIISELVKKGFSYLGFDASKKLEELETKLLLLERVMEAVEESPYRPRLERLFRDLKSAFYEAEDILDVVDYHVLERQIQDSKAQSDGDAPTRKRDWVKRKLQSAMPSSPLKNQVLQFGSFLACPATNLLCFIHSSLFLNTVFLCNFSCMEL
jgi:hypothetical protein